MKKTLLGLLLLTLCGCADSNNDLRNQAQTQAPYRTDLATGSSPLFLKIGDINGDGLLDLVLSDRKQTQLQLWAQTAGRGFINGPANLTLPSAPGESTVGDFNGDGKADVAVTLRGGNQIAIFLGAGNGIFNPGLSLTVGQGPQGLLSVDVNGDKKLDLVCTNVADNSVSWCLGNGDGTFGPAQTLAVGKAPVALAAADIDGDGKSDLAISNFADNSISILTNNGAGGFQAGPLLPAGGNPFGVALADLDRDGRVDLIEANELDGTVWKRAGLAGGFGPAQVIAVSTTPDSKPDLLALADFNGDGNLDVAVSCEGQSAVVLLPGDGRGSLFPGPVLSTNGGPVGIGAGDLNGDGRPDLATANFFGAGVSLFLSF